MQSIITPRRRFRTVATTLSVVLAMLVGGLGVTAPAQAATMTGGWEEPVSLANPAAGWMVGCDGTYIADRYHIGRDYWASANTPVRAIGNGVVHSNGDFGAGYARALFVKHTAADGAQFLVLYGHVNSSRQAGDVVGAGDVIATIANIPSGPHLHLGLIPGTTRPSSGWGNLPCPKGSTNGFVDPIPFLAAHPQAGAARFGSDVDGNGGADLILTTQEAGGSAAASSLLSAYADFWPQRWWTGASFGWDGMTPMVGDVNGDHKADYVFLTREAGGHTKAFVALSNGGTFTEPQLWWNGQGWGYDGMKASLGDVDGNGADLVIMTSEPNGADGFVLLSTYGTFMAPQLWWDGAGFGWNGTKPFVGDVNGDNRADFIYLTDEPGGTKAFVAKSVGNGFIYPQLWWNGVGWGFGSIKPAIGDVDGNGGADLVIMTQEANGSAAGFALLSTYEGFSNPQFWWDGSNYGWSEVTPMVGDVDSNGRADFVYLTRESGGHTKAFVAKSAGNGFIYPELWWNGFGWGYDYIKPFLM